MNTQRRSRPGRVVDTAARLSKFTPVPTFVLLGAWLALLGGSPALAWQHGSDDDEELYGATEASETEIGLCGVVNPDEGDESIGSLPSGGGITGGVPKGAVTDGPPLPPLAEPMSVTVTAPASQLTALLLGSSSDEQLTWAYYPGPEGELMADVTLHGEMTLALEKQLAESGRIQIRVHVGLPFAGGLGSVSWKGGRGATFSLPSPGSIPLPASSLLKAGVLSAGDAVLDLWSATDGRHGSVRLETLGSALHVVQDLDY